MKRLRKKTVTIGIKSLFSIQETLKKLWYTFNLLKQTSMKNSQKNLYLDQGKNQNHKKRLILKCDNFVWNIKINKALKV